MLLDVELPTELLCPSRLVACPKSLGVSTEMPSGLIHWDMNSIMVKLETVKLFASRFCNMCLCAAFLLSQRGFTYHELYPPLSPALVPPFQDLAISTSVGKSFTTLCLSLLSSLPLDCDSLRDFVIIIIISQHLAPCLAHGKCSVNVWQISECMIAEWGGWNLACLSHRILWASEASLAFKEKIEATWN